MPAVIANAKQRPASLDFDDMLHSLSVQHSAGFADELVRTLGERPTIMVNLDVTLQ
jgi:hypothetical protein